MKFLTAAVIHPKSHFLADGHAVRVTEKAPRAMIYASGVADTAVNKQVS